MAARTVPIASHVKEYIARLMLATHLGLVFAFFAWPVGLGARRSGRSVGFAIGLFVAIAYWGMLFAGRTFGQRLAIPPALAMWLPDAIVFTAGVAVAAVRAGGRR